MQEGNVNFDIYTKRDYVPGKSTLVQTLWYFVNCLCFINPLNPLSGIKVRLLRLFGAKVGKNVVIKPGVNIKYPWRLTIGDNVWLGENIWIDNLVQVTIGNNVCISQGAMLLTGNHDYKKASFDLIVGEITLADGVWIGAKSTVCPGVTCASHSILTVNSMTSKHMEAYGIYTGVPAVLVRKRKIEG
ncbi:WcaF family extracellular polysaccharide biosynthesis acetyltransferase [Chitinophaga sp. Hz27]|uniref:WcaF family extracellular polysaccharide biosynthesis acetyltransferase n=1 Tax=Chitinophaga sp. Hz27 TaxID=3347169 RepID=UPI0035D6E380